MIPSWSRIPLNKPCGRCLVSSPYGKTPAHNRGCGAIGADYDKDCGACGHWLGQHTLTDNECVYEGCACSDMTAKPAATKPSCDCGGLKLGYPPGILHSHWNRPKDKSKWCPMRIEK